MAVLSTADRQLALAILCRRFGAELAAANVEKPALSVLIAEVDVYCDSMDATRPSSSLAAACSPPFAGAGAGQVAARAVVSGVVQALRARAGGLDILRIGSGA